jgi:hypothetical protein
MTLRLGKDETVVAVLLPEQFRNAPDGIDLSLADRKKGLLLRSVRLTGEATSEVAGEPLLHRETSSSSRSSCEFPMVVEIREIALRTPGPRGQ